MRLPVLLSLIVLSACQQASTLAPMPTKAELEAERQTQSDMAKAGKTEYAANLSRAEIIAKLDRVVKQVKPASRALCTEIKGGSAPCNFDIALAKEGGLNAYADGEKVVMFPEMVAFTANDTELALVVAHELAHNIMRHPDAQKQNVALGGVLGTLVDQLAQSQGINTGGMAGKLGAQGAVLRYSSGFEREADYVALYILARAGYDVSEAPQFWRRMSAQNPDSIYVGTTHPTNPDRYITLQKTINEIEGKQRAGAPLIPQIRQDS